MLLLCRVNKLPFISDVLSNESEPHYTYTILGTTVEEPLLYGSVYEVQNLTTISPESISFFNISI